MGVCSPSLEDLSETHALVTAWPLPPSDPACERIVDTWASFHAYWWRHPSLGRGVGTFLDEAALAMITAEYRERYTRFAGALADRLWPAARAIYARVHDARDRLITPARLYATYTIGHGDAHVWNLLYPRDDVYRLSVIGHLAIPVWQETLGIPPAVWWSHLHRIIAAFEDLDCATLL